jgi:hypothetical protein
MAMLERMQAIRSAELIFEGTKRGRPLSNMSMLAVLSRRGHVDLTVYGFRSTFRDWAAGCTSFPSEVAEMALAHAIDDKVEAAYRRGDLFEKRRGLMETSGAFCSKQSATGEVIRLSKDRKRAGTRGRTGSRLQRHSVDVFRSHSRPVRQKFVHLRADCA